VTVTKGDWLAAVHAHSRDTVTFTVPVPPEAGNDDVALLTVAWHRTPPGAVTFIDVDASLPHAAATVAAAITPSSRALFVLTRPGDAEFRPAEQNGRLRRLISNGRATTRERA
jgi:hypothetical protein